MRSELRQQRVAVKAQLGVAEEAEHALDALGAHVGAPLVDNVAGHGGPSWGGRHVGIGLGLARPLGPVNHLVVETVSQPRREVRRVREHKSSKFRYVFYSWGIV